jgi:hypothetical protein
MAVETHGYQRGKAIVVLKKLSGAETYQGDTHTDDPGR